MLERSTIDFLTVHTLSKLSSRRRFYRKDVCALSNTDFLIKNVKGIFLNYHGHKLKFLKDMCK